MPKKETTKELRGIPSEGHMPGIGKAKKKKKAIGQHENKIKLFGRPRFLISL